MWIETLEARQFRNTQSQQVDCVPHQNAFIGENAAGKTNILELLYYLSHGKSPRTRTDRELIHWGESFAAISVHARSHRLDTDVTVSAQLVVTPQNTLKTTFKLNGQPVKSRSQIVGKIPTVTFFLNDLLMLRGTPENRRNALDSSLVQFDPVHFQRLANYQRIRQQKGQMLKLPPYQQDSELLNTLNRQLAQAGAVVMQNRVQYLTALEPYAQEQYANLSRRQEALSFLYQPSSDALRGLDANADVEVWETALYDAIQASGSEESRRGQVLIGPHRDDITFNLDGHDASTFGSQGQQRSIVLALKLSEINSLTERLEGEVPVLLLDDVMAELDPIRQHQLLSHLDPQMQVFLTTTHLDNELTTFLAAAPSVRIFSVENGAIQPGKFEHSFQNQTENPGVAASTEETVYG